MKRNKLYCFLFTYSFFLFYTHVFSQAGGIQCNPNSFWATDFSNVDEYTINGNTITFSSTICQAFNGNLAFCNNLNTGSFSPTFYSTDINHSVYYNGTNWIVDSVVSIGSLFNGGGNGNFLYFTGYPPVGSLRAIVRYNGITFNTIYTVQDPDYYISVKDLAVDDSGNVWFFTGLNQAPFYTDSLNVVSPSGQLIKQFPFSINSNGAYGCFLLNNIIYVGVSPINSLIPISISNDSAIAGAPIPMISGYVDLASCNSGLPLSIKNNSSITNFDIYPNPVSTFLNVEINKNQNITITNLLGEIIFEKNFLFTGNRKIEINASSFSSGIYFIKVGNAVRKFIKE